jgi:hypothetical protein
VIQDRKKQLEELPSGSPTASADEDASVGECDENLSYKEWRYIVPQPQ